MPTPSPMPLRDPLKMFLERRGAAPAQRPVPLIGTDFAVAIDGGLAVVTTTRVFRNEEANPIEATLTFPMPVHATLFDLRVRIGERELIARAQARERARATYEDAIDRGKSAVLHEEVLRGIHMLSVANIPAGEKITVTTQWVTTLAVISSAGHLRIPVTVGDVYGRSPLAGSDDIKIGGKPLSGTLDVQAPDAQVRLEGGSLENGKARLLLNRPIDLIVENWRPGTLTGTAADGGSVSLTLEPAPDRDQRLNIAILVDHSTSMAERARSGILPSTKHDCVLAALRRLAGKLAPEDAIDLWEFDDAVNHIGSGKLGRLVDRLSPPAGGTEIGRALARSIAESSADSVLLITDGKSHALDVQGLARMGRRISVVLVGEDSLEANVGHLAALTGGDIFVSGGADIGDLLDAALKSLRRGGAAASAKKAFQRSGMMVTVSHGASSATAEPTGQDRAVAVAAASFLLPTLDKEQATALAEREGIVSHLTSLVLVDEAGATQETLPAQRPVALPEPAIYACHLPAPEVCRPGAPSSTPSPQEMQGRRRALAGLKDAVVNWASRERSSAMDLARRIDWASEPASLIAGDLSELSPDLRKAVLALAQRGSVKRAAATLGLSPLSLVIALLAHQAGNQGDRAAARIAHRLLGQTQELQKLVSLLDG